MNTFTMSNQQLVHGQWLIFIGILFAIGIGVTGFAIWFFALRGSGSIASQTP